MGSTSINNDNSVEMKSTFAKQLTEAEFLSLANKAEVTRDHHCDDNDFDVYVRDEYTEHGQTSVYKDLNAGATWANMDINGVTFEYCQAWSMYVGDADSFDIGDHAEGCNRIYEATTKEITELPFAVIDDCGNELDTNEVFDLLITNIDEFTDFSNFKKSITGVES